MRLRSTALLIVLMSGCALDHGRDGEDPAPFCGQRPPLGGSCAAVSSRARTPEGACVDESGRLLIFLRSDQPFVYCSVAADGSVRALDDHCRPPGELRGLVYDYCEGVDAPVSVGRATIDVSEPGTCGFSRPFGLREVVPSPRPEQLCTNPQLGDCRAPVRFDLELGRAADCDLNVHHQCVARWSGDDIVVELTSYATDRTTCESVIEERVARCAVMVSTPADYPVRTTDGVELGTLRVGDGRGDDVRTCVDVP